MGHVPVGAPHELERRDLGAQHASLHEMAADDGTTGDVEIHVAAPAGHRRRRVVQAVPEVRTDDLQLRERNADPIQKDGLHSPGAVPRAGLGLGFVAPAALVLAR